MASWLSSSIPGRVALAAASAVMLALGGCDTLPAPTIGALSPAFTAQDLDGGAVSLADLRGEVVLLNVWATWCYPCRREMPSLEALYRDLGDQGLRVVAVSIDTRSAEADVREFIEEYGISFDILLDPDKAITHRFRTSGVPETFLIDRNGVLVNRWIGRIDGRSPAVLNPVLDALES